MIPGALNRLLAFLWELHPRCVAQVVFTFLSGSGPPHLGSLASKSGGRETIHRAGDREMRLEVDGQSRPSSG